MSIHTWLPQPLFSVALLLTWLMLVNGLTASQFLLGVLLSLGIPWFSARFWPDKPRLYRPVLLPALMVRVLWDILWANLVVAKWILWRSPETLRSRFVLLPLALQDEFAITLLVNIISLTPGTVSSELSLDRRRLLIHCLNVTDEKALVRAIKARYEEPLRQIFEPC